MSDLKDHKSVPITNPIPVASSSGTVVTTSTTATTAVPSETTRVPAISTAEILQRNAGTIEVDKKELLKWEQCLKIMQNYPVLIDKMYALYNLLNNKIKDEYEIIATDLVTGKIVRNTISANLRFVILKNKKEVSSYTTGETVKITKDIIINYIIEKSSVYEKIDYKLVDFFKKFEYPNKEIYIPPTMAKDGTIDKITDIITKAILEFRMEFEYCIQQEHLISLGAHRGNNYLDLSGGDILEAANMLFRDKEHQYLPVITNQVDKAFPTNVIKVTKATQVMQVQDDDDLEKAIQESLKMSGNTAASGTNS